MSKNNKTEKRKKLFSDSVFGNKYWKIKINYCNDKITANFKNVKTNITKPSKKGSKFICKSSIIMCSVFRSGKNYYTHTFLEECK